MIFVIPETEERLSGIHNQKRPMSLDQLFDTSRRAPRLAGRGLIKAYRYTLSPLVGFHCRHLPTCSDYADQAIERYGLWAGGWMTLARLLRCHPWGTHGLDFVCDELPAEGAVVFAVALCAVARHQLGAPRRGAVKAGSKASAQCLEPLAYSLPSTWRALNSIHHAYLHS